MKEDISKVLEKLKNVKSKSNKVLGYNQSFKYKLSFALIIVGYLFFFFSNSIFNSEGDIKATPFDQVVAMQNNKIIMKSAKYSNENKTLEVNFQMDKVNLLYDKELIVAARERNNPDENIESKLINLNGKDYTVVVKLPKEWTTVLLTFTENDEDQNYYKFYVDRRESKEDSSLKEKTRREYLLQTVDEEIKEVNKKLTEIDIEIQEKSSSINRLKDEIARLENEKKYLVESELVTMNSKIEQLYSQTLDDERAIEELSKNKEEMKVKIEKLAIKRADYDKISD